MACYSIEVSTWDQLLSLLQGRFVVLERLAVLSFDLLRRFMRSLGELLLRALLVEVLHWRTEVEMLRGLGVDERVAVRRWGPKSETSLLLR